MKIPQTEQEKDKRWNILWLIFTLLSIAQAAVLLIISRKLPARVPVHYNISFHIDRWGSPWELRITALISPILFILRPVISRLPVKTAFNAQLQDCTSNRRNRIIQDITILFVGSFLAFLSWWTMIPAFKPESSQAQTALRTLPSVISFPIGIFAVVIGNYMGTIKPNRTLGIKVKWTFENRENWRRTHRFASYTTVTAGIIMTAGACLGLIFSSILCYIASYVLFMLFAVVFPVIYSWHLSRILPPDTADEGNTAQ